MTPDEESDALTAEIARQREQITVLVSRVRKLEAWLAIVRRAQVLGAI